MPQPEPLPRGPRFFTREMPPAARRGRLLLVAVVLAAALSFNWPIYPLFGGIKPLILGLPLSFAWVVFWLLAVFAVLLALYRIDHGGPPPADRRGGEGGER